jgi:hypothetical protein
MQVVDCPLHPSFGADEDVLQPFSPWVDDREISGFLKNPEIWMQGVKIPGFLGKPGIYGGVTHEEFLQNNDG